MSGDLEYITGRLKGGVYVAGAPSSWEWVKNGTRARAVHRAYDQGNDFFTVHWQVNNSDAAIVRLHVESPRHSVDSALNGIKGEVIRALQASNVPHVVAQKRYTFIEGPKTSDDEIRKYKSSEAFRVVLNENQRQATPEKSIEAVHAAVGSAVDAVVQPFARTLNQHFRV